MRVLMYNHTGIVKQMYFMPGSYLFVVEIKFLKFIYFIVSHKVTAQQSFNDTGIYFSLLLIK